MGSLMARALPEGSTRGAVFNIASATLGAGALGLPYAFKQSGYVLTLGMLILTALATVHSIKLLLFASRIASGRCRHIVDSYEDLAGAVFGNAMRHLVEVMMILFCFGTAVAYCVAVGDILEPVRRLDWMPSSVRDPDHGRTVVMVSFWTLFMFPLSLLQSVSSLQFSSFLGVGAIMFLVIATVNHCVHNRFINEWDCAEAGGSKCLAPYTAARFDLDTVTAFPLIMFAFTCQVNVYDIYRELRFPSERKMIRISCIGMFGICLVVYAAMGLFGYLDFKTTVQGNILTNFQYQVGQDAMITGAFVAIAITVVVAFPLLVFPCRESIFSILRAPATKKDRDRIIDQYRTGIPELTEKYIVGPGARKEDSLMPSSSNTPQCSPQMVIGVEAASMKMGSKSIPECDAISEPLLHHREVTPGLLLPTFPVEAESYYVPPVPTRVYTRPPFWQHLLVSAGISIGAIVAAIFIPSIQIVFSLLGGICSSFLCFIFPALCAKRLGYCSVEEAGILNVVATEALLWGGCAAGLFSTAITVYTTWR